MNYIWILNNQVTDVLVVSVVSIYLMLYYILKRKHKLGTLNIIFSSTFVIAFVIFLRDNIWTVFANLLWSHYTPPILILRGVAALGLGLIFHHLKDYVRFGKITRLGFYSMVAMIFISLSGIPGITKSEGYVVYGLTYLFTVFFAVSPFLDKIYQTDKLSPVVLFNNIRWRLAQFFERRWDNRLIQKYSTAKEFKNFWVRDAKDLVRFYGIEGADLSEKRVLEIGSAQFGVVSILNPLFGYAVDPILKEFPEYVGFHDGAMYIPKKAENLLEFMEPKSIDIAFCNNTINHVENPQLVISNLHDVLVTGGILYFDVHIQRLSHVHPHRFTPESAKELISSKFNIVEEFNTTNSNIFSYKPSKNVPVWGCKAIRVD